MNVAVLSSANVCRFTESSDGLRMLSTSGERYSVSICSGTAGGKICPGRSGRILLGIASLRVRLGAGGLGGPNSGSPRQRTSWSTGEVGVASALYAPRLVDCIKVFFNRQRRHRTVGG